MLHLIRVYTVCLQKQLNENIHQETPKTRIGLFQTIKMDKSAGQKGVKPIITHSLFSGIDSTSILSELLYKFVDFCVL